MSLSREKIDDKQAFVSEWLFINPYVLDVSEFKNKHPGGQLALEHGKYQDMSDYFAVFHPAGTEKYLSYYSVGKMSESNVKWNSKCKYSLEERSAISSALNQIHSNTEMNKKRDAVIAMHNDLLNQGHYQTDYGFYYRELVKLALLAASSVLLLAHSWYISSAIALGVFWHQLAFIGHDLGHNAVSHSSWDYKFGILGNLFGGISLGWWKYSHNVHHIITNDPHHDPDIQHLPFFAVTTEFFNSIYSSFHRRKLVFDSLSRFVVRFQHHIYYFVLMFGRFNLYVQSYVYLSGMLTNDKIKYRKMELLYMLGFAGLYFTLLSNVPGVFNKLLYTFICHALTALLHVQITLSHFAMDTNTPLHESMLDRMLRTTMDVDCFPWIDWLHGGLQFQTTHHVFPRLPRNKLRLIRVRLMKMAEELNVDYKTVGFLQGNGMVLNVLRYVANLAKKHNKIE